MKRVLACLAVMAAAVAAEAEECGASFKVDITPSTHYIWRGMPLTDGAVLQPSYTFAAKGVSVNNWQNVDLDNSNGMAGATTENDWNLGYEFQAGKARVSLGLLYYNFPGTAYEPTTEVSVGASFEVAGSPSITLYRDLDDTEGLYAAVGFGHGFKLGAVSEQTLDLALTIGFGTDKNNEFYYSRGGVTVDKAGLTDLLFTVSSTFKLDESFSIRPALPYASVINPDIVDAFDAADADTS